MNATNTWKDTVGSVAVLLAIVLSALSGFYIVFVEPAPLAVAAISTNF